MICAGNDYRKTSGLADIIYNRMARKPESVLVVGCGAGVEAAILANDLQAEVTGIRPER